MGKKKKISLTIDTVIFEAFKRYCEQNGMKVSTKVELLMKDSTKDISLKSFMK